jgi:hypothetical protein
LIDCFDDLLRVGAVRADPWPLVRTEHLGQKSARRADLPVYCMLSGQCDENPQHSRHHGQRP